MVLQAFLAGMVFSFVGSIPPGFLKHAGPPESPSQFSVKFQESGFRRGFLLSILNPQAIPFWMAITAYLKAQYWIDLTTALSLHSYLIGTSVGVMLLLIALSVMARKVSSTFQTSRLLRMLPGSILILLGLTGLGKYFLF